MLSSLVLVGVVALAQPTPLSGPSVERTSRNASLVARDFDGNLRRPQDTTPEEAALDKLGLPPDARRGADAVLAKRAAFLDRFIAENAELLGQLQTATASGDAKDRFLLIAEAWKRLAPLRAGGPLERQIARTLPENARHEFTRVLDEYDRALLDEARRNGDKGALLRGAVVQDRLQSLGREIERAAQRANRSGGFAYAFLTRGLTLTKAQQATIRDACRKFTEEGGDAPTKKQQEQLFARVYAALDEPQRKTLLRNVGRAPTSPQTSPQAEPPVRDAKTPRKDPK